MEKILQELTVYFSYCLKGLPQQYQNQDSNFLTILYFTVSGLDIIGKADMISLDDRKKTIEFIYSLQIEKTEYPYSGGFAGSPDSLMKQAPCFSSINLANTYVALVLLRLLGDDLSRVNKANICSAMRSLQTEQGSFYNAGPIGSSECDMRFVYSACVVSSLINDWSGMDIDRTIKFILSTLSYDYGFGTNPHCESHCGIIYCAVASLSLMGKLSLIDKEKMVELLVKRQSFGFHGRINKDDDSCYSFWVGASLKILDSFELIDKNTLKMFIQSCQCKGGFSKHPDDEVPDALHTYFSICGLSLIGVEGFAPINPLIGMKL